MKSLLKWYLIIKVAMFGLCLIACLPLAIAMPQQFLSGVCGFLSGVIADAVRYGILTEEDATKYRMN